MKYLNLLSVLFIALILSCNKTTVTTNGDWIKLSSLDGVGRQAAAGFAINNIGYLGLGSDENNNYLLDFWKYDPVANAWTQLADFPKDAGGRTAAVGFSSMGKGYITTGWDMQQVYLKDTWEYNPTTNKWAKKADFAGSARRNAVSFSVSDYGYVGTGYDGSYLKDFYKYDPAANAWTRITSISGTKRAGAASFVIGNKAYVGCGNDNGTSVTDFWSYDPAANAWTSELDFSDASIASSTIARSYGVGFTNGSKGYFAVGTGSSTVWAYDPIAKTWTAVTGFEGSQRSYAVGWTLNNTGYVTTGANGISRLDDIWSFTPDVAQVYTNK